MTSFTFTAQLVWSWQLNVNSAKVELCSWSLISHKLNFKGHWQTALCTCVCASTPTINKGVDLPGVCLLGHASRGGGHLETQSFTLYPPTNLLFHLSWDRAELDCPSPALSCPQCTHLINKTRQTNCTSYLPCCDSIRLMLRARILHGGIQKHRKH